MPNKLSIAFCAGAAPVGVDRTRTRRDAPGGQGPAQQADCRRTRHQRAHGRSAPRPRFRQDGSEVGGGAGQPVAGKFTNFKLVLKNLQQQCPIESKDVIEKMTIDYNNQFSPNEDNMNIIENCSQAIQKLNKIQMQIITMIELLISYCTQIISHTEILMEYLNSTQSGSNQIFRVFQESKTTQQIIRQKQLLDSFVSENSKIYQFIQDLHNFTSGQSFKSTVIKFLAERTQKVLSIVKIEILVKIKPEKTNFLFDLLQFIKNKKIQEILKMIDGTSENWVNYIEENLNTLMGNFLNKQISLTEALQRQGIEITSIKSGNELIKQLFDKIKQFNAKFGQLDSEASYIEEYLKLSQLFNSGQFDDFCQFMLSLDRIINQINYNMKHHGFQDQLDEMYASLDSEMQNFEKYDTKVAILKRLQEMLEEHYNQM